MKTRRFTMAQMCMAFLALPCFCMAQQTDESESAIDKKVDEVTEAAERWNRQNAEQMERWAEQHAQRWEKWASEFEKRWEEWARDQESTWKDWTDKYADRWESWSKEISQGDIDPEMIRLMVDRNLELIGEMPLGQMIEEVMEKTGEINDAPWDSLQDLQDIIGESIEHGLQEVEELDPEQYQEVPKKLLNERLERLQSALDKLHEGLAAQSQSQSENASKVVEEYETQVQEYLKALELAADKISTEQRREMAKIRNQVIRNRQQKKQRVESLEKLDANSRPDVDRIRADLNLGELRSELRNIELKQRLEEERRALRQASRNQRSRAQELRKRLRMGNGSASGDLRPAESTPENRARELQKSRGSHGPISADEVPDDGARREQNPENETVIEEEDGEGEAIEQQIIETEVGESKFNESDLVRMMLRQLESERNALKQRNREIEQLRKEMKELRRELIEQRKDKQRTGNRKPITID